MGEMQSHLLTLFYNQTATLQTLSLHDKDSNKQRVCYWLYNIFLNLNQLLSFPKRLIIQTILTNIYYI